MDLQSFGATPTLVLAAFARCDADGGGVSSAVQDQRDVQQMRSSCHEFAANLWWQIFGHLARTTLVATATVQLESKGCQGCGQGWWQQQCGRVSIAACTADLEEFLWRISCSPVFGYAATSCSTDLVATHVARGISCEMYEGAPGPSVKHRRPCL